MGLVESEAVIIRTYNLAEADKIVVSLTRRVGLVRAVARGARRLKSKYGAGLEPFTLVNLSFYEKEGRELHSLREIEIVRSYFHLSSNMEVSAALGQMSELVLEFAPPHEPNERLFRMVKACLAALSHQAEDFRAILLYFELWLLKLAGFLPGQKSCTDCGGRLPGQGSVYLNMDGKPRCRACSGGQGTPLSGEAHAQVLAAQSLSPEEFAERTRLATEGSQREIEQLTGRLIERILERELRTRASLKALKIEV
jgi:DNA repair protein RecO (recombination protein O)